MSDLLKRLSEAVGVSGAEAEVRKLVLDAIKDRVEDVTVDPMGNLTAIRRGGASPLRVMVAAHMDEVGFMVTEVDGDGLIHVAAVGRHDKRLVPWQRLWVGKDRTPGVFLWRPIHVSQGENNLIEPKDMVIDIGADNKEGVKAGPGERIAFAGGYQLLGTRTVRGKAFDSRAACTALIELLMGDPFPFDLYTAFTAQAMIGGRGALVAAHRLSPQVAVILTGVACNDLPADPDRDDYMPAIRLGGGPVISMLDAEQVGNRRLIELVRNVAKTHDIAYQLDALKQALPESSRIGLSRDGIATVMIGVPVRYLGSPNSLLNLDDLANMVTLVRESLLALTPDLLEH